AFDFRRVERVDFVRLAGSFCDGPPRVFLCLPRPRASAFSYARPQHRAAGGVFVSAAAEWAIPRALYAGDFPQLDLIRDDRGRGDRLAKETTGDAPALPGLGLSGGTHRFCTGFASTAVFHVAGLA